MNDLCTDIGYISLAKFGEQLCGDHIDIGCKEDGSMVVVLRMVWEAESRLVFYRL